MVTVTHEVVWPTENKADGTMIYRHPLPSDGNVCMVSVLPGGGQGEWIVEQSIYNGETAQQTATTAEVPGLLIAAGAMVRREKFVEDVE